MLGLSQGKLGEVLGLSLQQIQKYERGANRIGPSRLLELARVLDVPVGFFFDTTDPVRAPAIVDVANEGAGMSSDDPMRQPEALELATSYFEIADPLARRWLLDLLNSVSTAGDEAVPPARRRRSRLRSP